MLKPRYNPRLQGRNRAACGSGPVLLAASGQHGGLQRTMLPLVGRHVAEHPARSADQRHSTMLFREGGRHSS